VRAAQSTGNENQEQQCQNLRSRASTEVDRVTVIGDWASTHANGRSSFTFDLDGDRIARMTIREG